MSNAATLRQFDWKSELEKTVVQSLTTSFGLDFLLIEDKKGGDVDTVHNARKGIYATEKEQQKYLNRKEYDSEKYHSHDNYKKVNKRNSELKENGELVDAYTGKTVNKDESMDLDHVVSAKTIHDDAGVYLAELNGADVANIDQNLKSTKSSVNRSKKTDDMDAYLEKIPQKIENKEKEIQKYKDQLNQLNPNTPEDRHKIEKLNKKIKNGEKYIDDHKNIDHQKAKEKAEQAKKEIDRKINQAYYTSTKFLKNTALQAGKKGLLTGTRQALGLVLAELWFELREQIPKIYQKCKNNFTLDAFLKEVSQTLQNIWERLKIRFKDLITAFKDGVLGGILSSLTTTFMNIFVTSTKLIGKMIREMWNSLVGVIKLVFFNPNNLQAGELLKEVLRLLGLGVSTLLGTMLEAKLKTVITFPFGEEIAAFLSALATGVLNLGFVYFLEHSAIANKVWDYLNKFSIDPSTLALDRMREINAELDRYLTELSKIEFNLNPMELKTFADQLLATNSELERSIILKEEIIRRNIEIPFESGNIASVRDFLKRIQNV